MLSANVCVNFDKKRAAAMIRAASEDALTIMGMQALQDTSKHVPKDQGTLESSGITHSDTRAQNGKFTMRWDTPYAQYLWHGDVMYGNPASRSYGPEKITFTSALAREEWAKYAHEVYGDEWRQIFEKALKRGLQEV